MNNRRFNNIIQEEISKAEVNSIVRDKVNASYKSSEFKKAIREIVADSINTLFKELYYKNNLWKTYIKNG